MATLAVITDEISSDLEHALAVCAELGINAVELRAIGGANIVQHDDTAVAAFGRAIAARGMRVTCIASPFLKTHDWGEDEIAREREMAVLRRSIEIAHALDAPIVRAFSFWRHQPDPGALRHPALMALQEATAICRDSGVLLGLENEHACTAATGEETAWFLDRIEDRTLGVIWDPGNEAVTGSEPFPKGYAAVRGRIHHIHLKDPRAVAPDPTFVPMGEGALDYVAQFRALVEDGYDGALSLETHLGTTDAEKETASRTSIAGIRRMAAEAGLELA